MTSIAASTTIRNCTRTIRQRRCYCYLITLANKHVHITLTVVLLILLCKYGESLSFSSLIKTNNNYNKLFPFNINNNDNGKIKRIPIAGRYSNMTISSIGCGTWSWGNRLLYNYNDKKDDGELYEAYTIVRNAGITFFDTADSYGTLNYNGRAEILLGQFERQYQSTKESSSSSILKKSTTSRRQNQNNNEQQIATKLAPYPWRITKQNILSAARGSIRRINGDSQQEESKQTKIAMIQAHWSTANYQPYQERAIWDGLADVYEKGLCDSIGVSNYGPQQLLKISNYYNNYKSNIPIGTAQIQYSLLTYADPITRDMDSICKETNTKLIAYSPLCLGLLTGKYTIDNVNSIQSLPRRQLFRELLPGATKLLQLLNVIAIDNNKSISQIALNWCSSKNTIPIPGCRTVQQATETINSCIKFQLSTSEMFELDTVALSVSKPMIQNVFQTK